MKKLFLALLFSGCLQGGDPSPVGVWYSARNHTDGCYITVSFMEDGEYSSDRICLGSTNPRYGSYSVDGDVIHVVDEDGPFDFQWGYEPHGDALWLNWNGHQLDLLHTTP